MEVFLTAFADEGESLIYLFEICESALMVSLANTRTGGANRTCVLRVDNQTAVAALVNGGSTSEIGAVLANMLWNVAARGAARWRVEYVNKKDNIADYPSRACGESAPEPRPKHCRGGHRVVPTSV